MCVFFCVLFGNPFTKKKRKREKKHPAAVVRVKTPSRFRATNVAANAGAVAKALVVPRTSADAAEKVFQHNLPKKFDSNYGRCSWRGVDRGAIFPEQGSKDTTIAVRNLLRASRVRRQSAGAVATRFDMQLCWLY